MRVRCRSDVHDALARSHIQKGLGWLTLRPDKDESNSIVEDDLELTQEALEKLELQIQRIHAQENGYHGITCMPD